MWLVFVVLSRVNGLEAFFIKGLYMLNLFCIVPREVCAHIFGQIAGANY